MREWWVRVQAVSAQSPRPLSCRASQPSLLWSQAGVCTLTPVIFDMRDMRSQGPCLEAYWSIRPPIPPIPAAVTWMTPYAYRRREENYSQFSRSSHQAILRHLCSSWCSRWICNQRMIATEAAQCLTDPFLWNQLQHLGSRYWGFGILHIITFFCHIDVRFALIAAWQIYFHEINQNLLAVFIEGSGIFVYHDLFCHIDARFAVIAAWQIYFHEINHTILAVFIQGSGIFVHHDLFCHIDARSAAIAAFKICFREINHTILAVFIEAYGIFVHHDLYCHIDARFAAIAALTH